MLLWLLSWRSCLMRGRQFDMTGNEGASYSRCGKLKDLNAACADAHVQLFEKIMF